MLGARLVTNDALSGTLLDSVFDRHSVSTIVRFSTCTCINRSMSGPRGCCRGGIMNALALLSTVITTKIGTFIFSSAYTACNIPRRLPVPRARPRGPVGPCKTAGLVMRHVLTSCNPTCSLGSIYFHCFGTTKTRPGNLLNRSRGPRARLVPLILRATLNGHRTVCVCNASCPATSNAYVHSCVRIYSLTSTRVLKLRCLLGNNSDAVFGLNGNDNFSIHRIVSTTTHVANGRVPIVRTSHHTKSPPSLIKDDSHTHRVLN